MALFAGDVGSYTTPDGRVVQMPAGLASQFPGLQPVGPPPTLPPPPGQQIGPPPGAPPAEPGDAAAPPAPMTSLPLPTGPAPTWTPEVSAELARQTVQSTGSGPPPKPAGATAAAPAGKPPGKPSAKPAASADQPAPPAPDAQRPMTDADLAKMGVSGGLNAYDAADDEKKAAISQKANAEVNQTDQVGAAMAANDADALKRLNDYQAESDRRQAAIDQHTNDLAAAAQKIANTKIDRTADHPILTAIGVALATLGTATQNRDATLAAAFRGQPAPAPIQNPGLAAMYANIDRKVAAQMADLDNQKAAYGLQSQALTAERGAMKDRLDRMAVMKAGFLDQAKGQIATIEKQTSSPIVKANAAIAGADIDREKAATLGEAQSRFKTQQAAEAARAQELKIAKMRDATERRGQDIGYQENVDRIVAQRQEKAADDAVRLLAEGKAEAAARMKIVGEQGIVDPSTGDFMLTPAGQQKMQQADQYEAQARSATDPQQAQKLSAAAQQLRDSARTNDAALAPNKKGGEEAQETVKMAQDLTNRIGTARQMLQAGPAAWDRNTWAALTVYLDGIKRDYAQGGKERLSPLALNSMEDVLSLDPQSLASRTIDKGKALSALDALEKNTAQSADVALKNAGVKSGWKPAKPAAAPKFSGVTATEAAEGQLPEGAIPTDNGTPYDPKLTFAQNNAINPGYQARLEAEQNVDPQKAFDAASSRTNAAGQSNAYGLKPEDHAAALAEIKRAGSAGNADYDRIVANLAAPMTNEKRPSLSRGLATLVNDEDPKLFEAVLAKVAGSEGELAAKRLRAMVAPTPGVRPAVAVPPSLGKMTPEALKAYNEVLRKQGLPEVAQ